MQATESSALNGRRYQSAGRSVCARNPRSDAAAREPVLPRSEEESGEESFAQVESLVAPNSSGRLKPGGSTGAKKPGSTAMASLDGAAQERPTPLGVRFSAAELETVKSKAKAAGCSTNSYIRASALGSDYRPPMSPELTRALLGLNRELAAQGNNLNQIARQLNGGIVLPGQGMMLDALAQSILETLRHVREALASGGPSLGT